MRKKIISIVASACLLPGLLPITSAFAKTSDENLTDAIQKLMQQTEALQQEVKSLRAELDQVKRANKQPVSIAQPAQKAAPISVASTSAAAPIAPIPLAPAPSNVRPGVQVVQPVIVTTLNEDADEDEETEQDDTELVTYLIGNPVLVSPVLNIDSQFNAADLIVNYPGINEDLLLLLQRKKLAEAIGHENMPSVKRPSLVLSGIIEALFNYQSPFAGSANNALRLSEAEVDVYADVSPWAHGFVNFVFDSNPLDPNLTGSGNAINNGRVFVDRGFVFIGDLSRSPLYFSAGRMFVPFGRYSSNMYSFPVTRSLGRVNANSALLGYGTDHTYASGYIYDGAVRVNKDASGVSGWGANIGHIFAENDHGVGGQIGAGYIADISESQRAQSPSGGGFSVNAATERLQHQVPGVDAHASVSKGPFSIRSEVVAATTQYATTDLTFNGRGASPKAAHIEGAYQFDILEKPSNISLAYGRTWEALAFNLPQQSYTATFNTSIWKNTVQTLEFRHDKNYSLSDTAGRICDLDNTGNPTLCVFSPPGPTQNSVFARLAVFF